MQDDSVMISVTGPISSGKSTILNIIKEALKEAGYKVYNCSSAHPNVENILTKKED